MMQWTIQYRWLLFILLCTFCALGTPYLQQALVPDNEIQNWFDKDDPALLNYQAFQKDFGNDRIINLAFSDEKEVLRPATLQKIHELTLALQEIKGVQKVWSVTHASDFRRVKEGEVSRICYCPWFEKQPDYQISDSLRQDIMNSELIVNRFVHENGKIAMLILQLEGAEEIENRMSDIVSAIDSIAAVLLGEGNFHLMGTDIITNGLNQLSEQDFMLFTGLCFGLIFLLITLFYRNISALLLVLSTVVFSVWASLSIYGLLGYRLNIFTVMTPLLIMVLGIITVMHILNEFEVQSRYLDRKPMEMVKQTLRRISRPCLFASFTTMLGFLSVLSTDMAILRQFGMFTALGIFFTLGFALFFSLLLLPMQSAKKSSKLSGSTGKMLANFAGQVMNYPARYWLLLLIIAGSSIAGLLNIRADMYPIGYFPGDHRVVQDHLFFNEQWGPYYPVDMVLQTDSLPATDLLMIRAIRAFEQEAISHPQIHQTLSYVQALERLAQVMYQKELQEVMANPLLARPFASLFRKLLSENEYGLLSEDRKRARITLIGPMLSIREMEKTLLSIQEEGKSHFQNLGKLQLSGYPSLFLRMMNYAFSSMTKSLLLSFLLVSLVMALMLKNLRLALLALLANMFPVLVLLGALGLLRINLDLATATITAIIFGIVVDDTIHFLYHYQQQREQGICTAEAIKAAQRHVGKVILLSSLLLAAGFSLMLLASLKTVFYFGLLSVISVMAALIGDLVLLPLLLRHMR